MIHRRVPLTFRFLILPAIRTPVLGDQPGLGGGGGGGGGGGDDPLKLNGNGTASLRVAHTTGLAAQLLSAWDRLSRGKRRRNSKFRDYFGIVSPTRVFGEWEVGDWKIEIKRSIYYGGRKVCSFERIELSSLS